jgi:hypothetical protein
VDETFAGQAINCPDCKQSLQVPGRGGARVRTSGLALTSFILALIGAFTVLGTLVAILLGGVALAVIRRQRDRLAGEGFALAGIILGVAFTALSVFAYTSVELFGLDAVLREPQWAGKLDHDGPMEVVRAAEGYSITRPSRDWGVFRQRRDGWNNFGMRDNETVLLVNPKESGYIVCVPRTVPEQWTLEECRQRAEQDFANMDLTANNEAKRLGLRGKLRVHSTRALPPVGDAERIEMLVDKQSRGQDRTFVLRVIRKRNDTMMYLVAGGARKDRFERVEADVRQALDSFRLTGRALPADWQRPNW